MSDIEHLTIHERDITSALCQRCAACCRIKLRLVDTDTRYCRFLRAVGLTVVPEAKWGESDCCGDRHDVTVDLGPCKHLRVNDAQEHAKYACALYGTDALPELCEQYNCVSWAKAAGSYNTRNVTLVEAQKAYDATDSLDAENVQP